MLNQAYLSHIKNLWRGEEYRALQALAQEMSLHWLKQGTDAQNEWDYLRNNLSREGRIAGIDLFLKEIEQIAAKQ